MVRLDYHQAGRSHVSSKFHNQPAITPEGDFMPTYRVEMLEGRTVEHK